MDTAQKPVTRYPDVIINVLPLPDGNVQLMIEAPTHIHLFPMGQSYADMIGKKLCAPRVVVPRNGDT